MVGSSSFAVVAFLLLLLWQDGKSLPSNWTLLGITEFDVSAAHDQDLWSDGDVYAWVTVQPSNLTYQSKVLHNTNSGHLDMHVWVPRSAVSAEVAIYDHDYHTSQDDLIGMVQLDLLGSSQAMCSLVEAETTGCHFHKNLTKPAGFLQSAHVTGSVTLYVATGAEMIRRADALSMSGIMILVDDTSLIGSKYELVRIPTDNVEEHIAFAKSGSVFPADAQGIWWMDQRGTHLPVASDPDYKQVCEAAADEILVSFGEAGWDPQSRCVTGVHIYGGGPLRGHWTWLDVGGGNSNDWRATGTHRPVADFCFTDESMQEVQIHRSFKVGNALEGLFGFNLPEFMDWSMRMPSWVMDLRMVRKPWGWDRVTYAGPWECHYPVFQIVDGFGSHTEHYNAYLAFANNQTDCPNSTFSCPSNRGNGTQLVARLSM